MLQRHLKWKGCRCPATAAAKLVGDAWMLVIVKVLLAGPRRFNQLQEAVNTLSGEREISTRTLAQRLRGMEENGLVHHEAHEGFPAYRLTLKGDDLAPIITALRQFGERHGPG